ncbi:MAG: undecaprenyl-diphosphate phosphatase [Dysgonamonadaceae bacterium]|jgi:undecaprenyl-diphosphatase|nr:undecaprenyl-diphosphate phosphatase [Dysgonamonadaceae bacterium]
MSFLEAIIIAIVEGLTEFLPVSSTAHMIFTETLLKIKHDNFVELFTYCIQFGAILAVVVLYWKKFFDFSRINFYLKLACGVLPALVLGKLLDDYISAAFENVTTIAIVLVLGGIFLLFVDKMFKNPKIRDEKQVSIKQAVIIGFWQCLAMMPGVSRSAASIIGGMQQKLSRETAAEFSFFLAVPTMLAVTVYALTFKKWDVGNDAAIRGYEMLANNSDQLWLFFWGNVVAFVVAMLAIKFFVGMIKKYGFKMWGWYRIIVGIAIFICIKWIL